MHAVSDDHIKALIARQTRFVTSGPRPCVGPGPETAGTMTVMRDAV